MYINCLITTLNEIDFYRSKFIKLSGEIQTAVPYAKKGEPFIVPSYKFYPSFLEKQKIELSKFNNNSELIRIIGNCHFELCHVQSKLESYVKYMSSLDQYNMSLHLLNAMGFKELIDTDAKLFEDAIQMLKNEIVSAQANSSRNINK